MFIGRLILRRIKSGSTALAHIDGFTCGSDLQQYAVHQTRSSFSPSSSLSLSLLLSFSVTLVSFFILLVTCFPQRLLRYCLCWSQVVDFLRAGGAGNTSHYVVVNIVTTASRLTPYFLHYIALTQPLLYYSTAVQQPNQTHYITTIGISQTARVIM